MTNFSLLIASVNVQQVTVGSRMGVMIPVVMWITGFLCLLNVGLAIFFRKRRKVEVMTYYAACGFELIIFVFALLISFDVVTHVPFHLPPGLPVNSIELGAALAFGIGLFPGAYWHRVNVSELPKRIAEDARAMKESEGRVRVRESAPGEWMNW